MHPADSGHHHAVRVKLRVRSFFHQVRSVSGQCGEYLSSHRPKRSSTQHPFHFLKEKAKRIKKLKIFCFMGTRVLIKAKGDRR